MILFTFGNNPQLAKWELEAIFKDFKVIVDDTSYVIVQFDDHTEETLIASGEELMNKLASSTSIGVVEPYNSPEQLIDIIKNEFFTDNLRLYLQTNKETSSIIGAIITDIEKSVKKDFQKVQYSPKTASYDQFLDADTFEIMLFEHNYEMYIGYTVAKSNTQEFKKLDESRPNRTFTHGTAPRLARTMVNLLELGEQSTVVDPFCGTGTFLLELMRQGHNVIGIDRDEGLLDQAEQNINWLNNRLESKKFAELIAGRAEETDFTADACVFEPYMGPFLTKMPTYQMAIDIREHLKGLYQNLFEMLHNNLKPGGPIVCILPEIPHKNGIIELDTNKFFRDMIIKKESPLFELKNPILYQSNNSILQRKIYILENI